MSGQETGCVIAGVPEGNLSMENGAQQFWGRGVTISISFSLLASVFHLDSNGFLVISPLARTDHMTDANSWVGCLGPPVWRTKATKTFISIFTELPVISQRSSGTHICQHLSFLGIAVADGLGRCACVEKHVSQQPLMWSVCCAAPESADKTCEKSRRIWQPKQRENVSSAACQPH